MPPTKHARTDPDPAPAFGAGPDSPAGAPVTDAASSFLKNQARRVRGPVALVAVTGMLGAGLMILQYRLLAAAINGAAFDGKTLDQLWPWLWPILPILFIRAGLVWLSEAASALAAAKVKQAVRESLMDRLLALGPVRLAGDRAGGLAALLTSGVEALEPYFARFLPAMTMAALIPLAVAAMVLPLDWPSTAILVLTAPLIPLFMILIGKGAEWMNRRQWAKLARMSAHFLEVVQGLTTLKLFNASRREAEIVARISEDYRLATMSVLRVAFLSALTLEFFATLGVALVAVFIGFRLMWGEMDFQRGFFVLLLAPEFYLPLRTLGAHYHARMEAIGAATALADLLARPILLAPPAPMAAPPPVTPPGIVFQDVHLDYAEGRSGLAGADFHIEAGCVTALVGPSGAGKSSIQSILLGFAAPGSGQVLVDGVPLAGFDLQAWRRRIAWVPQRPHLFRASIADNIRMGDPSLTREALEEAARQTGAWDFIRSLPDGLDHPVQEGGGGLSGGQARLIALTRAAARRNATFLILDEPTASLDSETERRAARALNELALDRTVLVVAHRLETVRASDSILVVEGGRIVEKGRHEDLVQNGGLYASMAASGGLIEGAGGRR